MVDKFGTFDGLGRLKVLGFSTVAIGLAAF
jgi:hypothetical protein